MHHDAEAGVGGGELLSESFELGADNLYRNGIKLKGHFVAPI